MQNNASAAPDSAGEDPDDSPSQTDAEIIAAAKAHLASSITAEGDQRDEALTDLRFLCADQWPEKAKRERELSGRPALTINKLPTFLHQVTNDQRQNVPSIKVSPVDGKTDPEVAEIIQGMIRHIEYDSNADVAYDRAVNSAAAIGFGYFMLETDFESPKSFDQVVKFKSIRNAFTVYPDPASVEPDGSDQKRCMISWRMDRATFKEDYPEAELTDSGFETGIGDSTNKDWLDKDFIRVASFYRIESQAATLVQLSNGETGFEEGLVELPPGITVTRSRPSARLTTMLYKLTALEVLERTEIKCPWIPVFPVYGDEFDLDGEIVRTGLIRNARDPQQMYNYWMTSATEEVAMRTKTPYIGAEGQFEDHEEEWDTANVTNYGYLEYKPVALEGILAPPPQRQPMADVPNGILTMALHANDNIKATTGLFDSSLGARGSATSGVQERQQQRQGDVANFHYADNLNRSVRHAGRCLVPMLQAYYDGARIARVMGEDQKIKPVGINQPIPPEQQTMDESGAIAKVSNDLTVGEFDVVVKAGPSYSTLREEALESMVQLAGDWPKLLEVAGDKIVENMDWPGAQGIAKRLKKTMDPAITQGEEDDGKEQEPMVQTPKGPIPLPQAGQMLAEMDQQIQAMGAELTDAKAGITKAKIQAEAQIKAAEIGAVSRSDVAEIQGAVALLTQKVEVANARATAAETKLAEASKPVETPAASQGPSEIQQALEPVLKKLAELTAPKPEAMAAGPSAPARARRRRIAITGPSGAVYQGDITDDDAGASPPA